MEQRAVDVGLVARKRADRPAVGGVPQLDQVVVAAGGQQLAVGADRDGANPSLVSLDLANRRAAQPLDRREKPVYVRDMLGSMGSGLRLGERRAYRETIGGRQ